MELRLPRISVKLLNLRHTQLLTMASYNSSTMYFHYVVLLTMLLEAILPPPLPLRVPLSRRAQMNQTS
jgi:hypothetical protein